MEKNRIEAFSDGVIAIIITIMVLEMKVPVGTDWSALTSLLPIFLSYVVSFLYVGIYWNNHHHLLKACRRVTGGILWANLHLLFWLSLFPFVTGWVGQNHFTKLPYAIYGTILFLAAEAYFILQTLIVKDQGGCESALGQSFGRDWKGKASRFLYLIGIGFSFLNPCIAGAIYVLVALFWLIPDTRIEKVIEAGDIGK